MRVDHQHFACARERTKHHEQVLPALPRQTLSGDRENIRTQCAQRLQTFQVTSTLKLHARDKFERAIGKEMDEFILPASEVAAERQQHNFHPRTLPSTNTSAND